MSKKYTSSIYSHLESNRMKYILVLFCLFLGITAGAIISSVVNINNTDKQYLNNFVSAYNLSEIASDELFKKSFFQTLRLILCIWLSGLSIWLIPFNLIEIVFKGFGIGYTVSYLAVSGGFKGFILAQASLLLPNIILIPPLLIFSVSQINFSIKRRKLANSSTLYRQKRRLIIKNISSFSFILIIAVFCSLLESYIIPLLIQPICSNFYK